MPNNPFPSLSPDLQIGFHYRLKHIKDLYFHEALSRTIADIPVSKIDSELKKYIPKIALQKLATFSIRGEAIFPVPIILNKNPFLIGYYRLLLGFSQKEFYSKGPYGMFKAMEINGKISKGCLDNLHYLTQSLIITATSFVEQLEEVNLKIISEMQILTVGPQLRGSINNAYGQIATEKTFSIIKELVKEYIISSTPTSIKIKNNSDRLVTIKFSSDPDIEIIEELQSENRGLISIEIKGGKDISNIHNRIGEAEKSHQKAKQRGYFEFMTIISVDFNYKSLKAESPTTSHFFNLFKISDNTNAEYRRFIDILSSIIGVKINSKN